MNGFIKLPISSQTGVPYLKEATLFDFESRCTKSSNKGEKYQSKQTFNIFVDDTISSEPNKKESAGHTPHPNVIESVSHQSLTDVPVEGVSG